MNSSVRLGVIGIVFFALLGLLTLRLWTMQVTEVQAYEEQALSNQSRVVTTPAPRGDVFDRNGVKLAGTRSALAVVVDLLLVEKDEQERLAQNLAAFLDTPASEILDAFENDSQGGLVTVAEDITDDQATFIVEHREQFSGVNIIPQPVRTYPEGEIAAHILGYIGRPNEEDLEREDVKGTDVVGKAGVERSYDAILRGTEGAIEYQVDAKRKVLSLAGEESPEAGGSLILTIDGELQARLQESLEDGLIQARILEMQEREVALATLSRRGRLEEALAEAQDATLSQLDEIDTSTTTATNPGQDDDDVASEPEEVSVDPVDVLASLYPGLPIDDQGVCLPVQRVTVLEGEAGSLSGIEPRFMRVESIVEVDGEFEATVLIGSDRYTVSRNESFAGTLQVLEVMDDHVVVYHRDKWCPVRSVGVVLDPNDGSILAMASYPAYDPSAFVDGLSQTQWESLGTVNAFQNFAVQGLYAPASTFKAVPYVLALEEDYYPLDRGVGDKEVGDDAPADETAADAESTDTTTAGDTTSGDDTGGTGPLPLLSDTDEYSCSGEFRFLLSDGTSQTKRDWKWPQGHGPLDLHGALQASCDLYFWDMTLRLWDERGDESGIDKENLLQEYSRDFGFGEATGVDLPFEKDGLVPDREWFREEQRNETGRVRPDGPWVGGDLMDLAVGQGAMLSTPLQLANGYAAMVNGGTVWQPRVVSQVVNVDGDTIEEYPRVALKAVELDQRTVQMLRRDLQQVVNNQERGTARAAFANFGPNVELIGGKTGTGEVIKAPRSDAFKQVDNAFFVGVAPINSPNYIVSVVVERGGSGGRVAAPVARQVLQYLLNGPDGVTELAPGLDAD
jgi:cell division protein FtsI/penicillin-binding protein 2